MQAASASSRCDSQFIRQWQQPVASSPCDSRVRLTSGCHWAGRRRLSGYPTAPSQWLPHGAVSVVTPRRHLSGYLTAPSQWLPHGAVSVVTSRRHLSGYPTAPSTSKHIVTNRPTTNATRRATAQAIMTTLLGHSGDIFVMTRRLATCQRRLGRRTRRAHGWATSCAAKILVLALLSSCAAKILVLALPKF